MGCPSALIHDAACEQPVRSTRTTQNRFIYVPHGVSERSRLWRWWPSVMHVSPEDADVRGLVSYGPDALQQVGTVGRHSGARFCAVRNRRTSRLRSLRNSRWLSTSIRRRHLVRKSPNLPHARRQGDRIKHCDVACWRNAKLAHGAADDVMGLKRKSAAGSENDVRGSRHFAAARQFGRFRTEADIGPDFMSTRPTSRR